MNLALALAQMIRLVHPPGKAATAEAAAISNFRLDGDSAVWYDAVTRATSLWDVSLPDSSAFEARELGTSRMSHAIWLALGHEDGTRH